MSYNFFSMFARMKYIDRWALMRNTRQENLSEHSADVAAIAHAIALIKNARFGGKVNAERAAFLGLYHDMPEIITGDMPTPVKYHSEGLHEAFLQVETEACDRLLSMLPDDLKDIYRAAFFKQDGDEELWKIVKAADKISALIKCIDEERSGNVEFKTAKESTQNIINQITYDLPEVDVFMKEFIPSYGKTLDELS